MAFSSIPMISIVRAADRESRRIVAGLGGKVVRQVRAGRRAEDANPATKDEAYNRLRRCASSYFQFQTPFINQCPGVKY